MCIRDRNKVAQAVNELIEQLLLIEKMSITENALYQASKELFCLCAAHPDYEPKNAFFLIDTEVSEEKRAEIENKFNEMMRVSFIELIEMSKLQKKDIAKLLQINAPHLSAILGGTKTVQIKQLCLIANSMNLQINIDVKNKKIYFET